MVDAGVVVNGSQWHQEFVRYLRKDAPAFTSSEDGVWLKLPRSIIGKRIELLISVIGVVALLLLSIYAITKLPPGWQRAFGPQRTPTPKITSTVAPEGQITATVAAGDAATPFPTASPIPPGTVLFEDNFDKGLKPEWYAPDWSVYDGMLVPHMADAYSFATVEEPFMWDYAIDFDLVPVGNADNRFGVLLRESLADPRDEKSVGGLFDITPKISGVLFKAPAVKNGPSAIIRGTYSIDPEGTFKHVRAEVQGDQYRLFIDGNLVLEASTDALPYGRPGLMAYRYSNLAFDNFKVTALP
jgi:hypothetical protein